MLNLAVRVTHIDGSETNFRYLEVDTIRIEKDDFIFLKEGKSVGITPKANVRSVYTLPEVSIEIPQEFQTADRVYPVAGADESEGYP